MANTCSKLGAQFCVHCFVHTNLDFDYGQGSKIFRTKVFEHLIMTPGRLPMAK